MINDNLNMNKEDKKLVRSTFIRTMTLSANYNYERMQAFGYVYSMIPAIEQYYKTEEEKIEAYKRHFELFNTTPTMGGFITGLTASMEKEAALDPHMDVSAINAIKVSLMGPLAGVGDSIFQGSLRVISLGVGISLAATGNFLGIILHLLLFNIPAHFVRYYGTVLGFGLGSNFIKKATETGLFNAITKGASIVGLMTVGAMTCTMVNFQFDKVLNFGGTELAVQSIFDDIFPNILPVLLTFICYKAVSKNVKPITIMMIMIVLSVLAKFGGII